MISHETVAPTRIAQLDEIWDLFRSQYRTWCANMKSIDEKTDDVTVGCSDLIDIDKVVRVAEAFIDRVIAIAQVELNPQGARLTILRTDVPYIPKIDASSKEDNLDELNLGSIWDDLYLKFAGACGVVRAASDAAKILFDTFVRGSWWEEGEKLSEPQRWRKTCECEKDPLYMNARVRDYGRPTPGGNCYNYDVLNTLHVVVTALVTMNTVASGKLRFGTELPAHVCRFINQDGAFRYGQRIEVNEHLMIILRKERIEFRFSDRALDVIRGFVLLHHLKPIEHAPDEEGADATG